ncbi:MAG: transposase family protein [Thermomicrobiales bacterium]
MILQYVFLTRQPRVFHAMTGLTIAQFDALCRDALPRLASAERQRLDHPRRQRAIGGGTPFTLAPRDQLLMSVVWLRRSPIHLVLGYLFGVSEHVVQYTLARLIPVLAAAGLDTMRLPDPGRKRRPALDDLLRETPELAVLVDTCEQRVQRAHASGEADRHYSGKKKTHTLKSQIVVDERDGWIVEVSESVPGPTADSVVLRRSGLLPRLPRGVGALGDLAYVGMEKEHPQGVGATPRRKPRRQPRPPEDVAYNRAFARRRVGVEHRIGRMRHWESVSQRDRHHRRGHTARMRAVAGLVNRTNWRRAQ